ncbi:MAG TPA: hypothetical protein VG733_09030 [Chthoniobacteraceae bacterium]|nr:hypothetical protein [Chthoniobacteraceae bacterium]
MKIRFQSYRRFTWVAGILAVPVALLLFICTGGGKWSGVVEIAGWTLLFSLGALGSLVAILERIGVVQFTYSKADRETFFYKMKEMIAEMERERGWSYSRRYFNSFDAGQNERDDG